MLLLSHSLTLARPVTQPKVLSPGSCGPGCTPAPTVHGDPMFKVNGSGTHFWLKTGKLMPLLMLGDVTISGKTFSREATGHQWFSELALTKGGAALDVSTDNGKMSVKLGGKVVQTGQLSAGGVHIEIKQRGVQATADGLKVTIYPSQATKFAKGEDRSKYAHLNIKFDSGIPSGSTGIFAELAGIQPVTEATAALLKPPKHAISLIQADSKCPPGCVAEEFDPKIASLATVCVHRLASGIAYADPAGSINATCGELDDMGWTLADSYTLFNPSTKDTDNADLRRNTAGDCVLAFHGSDAYEVFSGNTAFGNSGEGAKHGNATALSLTTRYGLEPLIMTHYIDELEPFLSLFRTKHGSLSAWAKTCPGRLFVAGHSMGGAMANLFAYWSNHPSDPLDLGKTVTGLYLFGADPITPTPLTNGQRDDGCFDGALYYAQALAGVIPGYPEVPDVIPVMNTIMYTAAQLSSGGETIVMNTKIPWISLDLAGPAYVASNRLGLGVQTPCGAVPPAYMAALSNYSIMVKAFDNYVGGIGTHQPLASLW